MDKIHYDGPVVLVVMDGIGLSSKTEGNALVYSYAEFLRNAIKNYPSLSIAASGEAVGLAKGEMGNSEVGHNTIGSGQITKQGTERINSAFETGKIWQSKAWQGIIKNLKKNNSTLHLSGIFSDGGVHSHISHLEKIIEKAAEEGIKKIRVHAIFDGRDVSPFSVEKYLHRFNRFIAKFNNIDIKIASGGGRMVIVSDRYEDNWGVVERGWNTIVDGKSNNNFPSAIEALETIRSESPELQDQYLPDFVIVDKNSQPVGKVKKGDSFIFFDFRADRAIEIARAFSDSDFSYFDRGDYSPDDICFAGMTEYDSDSHIPKNQLVPPVKIKDTLSAFLGKHNISQLAISETSKFGHITYYFNGNSHSYSPNEDFVEITSSEQRHDVSPWMQATKLTDTILENLEKYRFVRVNYPNGDMVGHYAELESGIIAVETVDLSLKRLAKKVDELGGMMLVIADHGNVEELLDENGKPMTSHTTNPVPCIFYDNTKNRNKYTLNNFQSPGLANIAATLALLLGQTNYPESWSLPLISLK